MGIFDKFKTSIAIDRLSEEKLYEQVGQELKAGKKREGIWVKAMAKGLVKNITVISRIPCFNIFRIPLSQ